MKTIAVINQRGGVGKSTTAQAIASRLSSTGSRVLFIDLDAQGNSTTSLQGDPDLEGILEALMGAEPIGEVVQHVGGLDLIGSAPDLSGMDIKLGSKPGVLRATLQDLAGSYDYCVIDTPPALGSLTVNALTAADGCVIPAKAELYSLQGILQLSRTIEAIRRGSNKSLRIYGILITAYKSRTAIARQYADQIEQTAKQIGTQVFKTRIRDCNAIVEAQGYRESIFDFAPRSNAAQDYTAFIDELREEIQHA